MFINTIRRTAYFSLINVNRTAFGMRKTVDIVTKAVFQNELTKIALQQGVEETRYPFIYDKTDTKSGKDLQELATTLQYISTLSRRRQSPIVDATTYQAILKQYYETFQSTLKSHLNWHIDPSYQLSYFLPSFIHTDNEQILQLAKLKQLEMFELLSRSREITLEEFMKIFSKDVYNVTDLPLLDSLLHEHFFPRIGQIQSLYQLEQVLQYLGRLESINVIALCKTIKLLKAEMEKEILKPHVSLDWYISFAGCISSVKFMDLKSITEQSHNQFQQILAKLTERTFNINGQIFQVASLGSEENMQKIISHMQTAIIKKLEIYKEEQTKNMLKESNIVMPKLVEQDMSEQWLFLGALNKEIVNKAIKLELIPKITKALLAINCLKPYPNQQLQIFLKSSLFQNFIVKYPCYPNLIKDLMHTLEFLKAQYNITMTINDLDAKVEAFRGKMNQFLNIIIKQSPDTQILENFNHPKQTVDAGSKNQFLWNLEGSALLTRLMTVDQGFTFSNVLSMLKEDTTFLQSRMKLSHKMFIKALINRNIKKIKIEIDYWNYPHCYTFANADNNFYGYVQHRFNQHSRIPTNCNVYTLTELDQIQSKMILFQNNK